VAQASSLWANQLVNKAFFTGQRPVSLNEKFLVGAKLSQFLFFGILQQSHKGK
jgi:hypothetical protein